MYSVAVQILTDVYAIALPIGIFYFICDLAVGTFLRAAFGGRLWFRQ